MNTFITGFIATGGMIVGYYIGTDGPNTLLVFGLLFVACGRVFLDMAVDY